MYMFYLHNVVGNKFDWSKIFSPSLDFRGGFRGGRGGPRGMSNQHSGYFYNNRGGGSSGSRFDENGQRFAGGRGGM